MNFGSAILILILSGAAAAGPPAKASLKGPAPADLRYAYPVGDVLAYQEILDTENSPLDHPDVSYTVREEWLIKKAVVERNGSTVGLAVQANRIKMRVTGRAALVAALGENGAANVLALYERAEPVSVRYLLVDDMGRKLNRSYSLEEATSFVAGSMGVLFRLPFQSVGEGWRTTLPGDLSLDVAYEGVREENGAACHVFSAKHRAGWALMAIDRDLGVPGRFEYAATYAGAGESRREHVVMRLLGIQHDAWRAWDKDPTVDRALVLGATAASGLTCRASIIKRFLNGKDEQKQNLAAAYCARRGVPDGLDMKRYLHVRNPIVRFNAAKAIYKFGGDARPLISKIRDHDPYISRRATEYLTSNSDILPPDRRFLYWVLQNWLYDGGEIPDVLLEDVESLRDLIRFLKPANDLVAGCYRFDLPGDPPDSRHPYYVALPDDYDPAESYPMLIYLGMGDGRGDYAFQAVYNGLRQAGGLSRFILLVPQANGKWWDEDVEPVLNRVLTSALKTLSVDTNQVFLAGSSNGGMGTIYFGTRLPDRFAGLAVNMGYPIVDRRFLDQPQDLDVLRNMKSARVFLAHGGSDDWVTPEGDQKVADILRQADGQVVQRVMQDRKHDIDIHEVIDEILKVFEPAQRDPYPRRIDFVLPDVAYARCFWIEAVGAKAGDKIQAEIKDNTVEILTGMEGRLRLYLDEKLVDMAKDVVVRVNGREVFRGPIKPTVEDLLFTLAKTLDVQAAYGACLEVSANN
ncbi:MAG: hypothetical protein PHI34_06180 [Acidobacteriota bacterium]|nr:hypothetical protein [Acidobacteriota bacterium]